MNDTDSSVSALFKKKKVTVFPTLLPNEDQVNWFLQSPKPAYFLFTLLRQTTHQLDWTPIQDVKIVKLIKDLNQNPNRKHISVVASGDPKAQLGIGQERC